MKTNRPRFIQDSKAKSLTYFLKSNNPVKNISQLIKKLQNISKKKHYVDCRINLHKNLQSSIHFMLLLFYKGKKHKPHYHSIDEWNYVIKGKFKVVFFDNKGKVIRNKTVCEKELIVFEKESIHQIIPLTKKVLILETRKGPFSRKLTTKYPSWLARR